MKRLALVAATVVCVVTFLPSSARAATPGTAIVVTQDVGSTTARSAAASGGVGSSFSLQLPQGAACSGDSAHGLYRVQSFMVTAATDIASLTFGAKGPLPTGFGESFRQPLYDTATQPYANAFTDVALGDGKGEGTIINVPLFSLSVFTAEQLTAGKYKIGIACTKGPASDAQLDRYWAADFELRPAAAANESLSWSAPGYAAAVAAEAAGAADPGANVTSPSDASTSSVAPSEPTGEVKANAGLTGGDPSLRMPIFEVSRGLSGDRVLTLLLVAFALVLLAAVRVVYLNRRRPFTSSSPI